MEMTGGTEGRQEEVYQEEKYNSEDTSNYCRGVEERHNSLWKSGFQLGNLKQHVCTQFTIHSLT